MLFKPMPILQSKTINIFSIPLDIVIPMLDNDTISELQVLENPKFSRYVKLALEDEEFLRSLISGVESEDWLLRWGISTVVVQVSKRKPELLKEDIPLLISRVLYEDHRMVRDNIAQSLLHLSHFIPKDFVAHDAAPAFIQYLKKGEDHERFDAIQLMGNIVSVAPEFVKGHLSLIQHAADDIDNPLVKHQAERVFNSIRSKLQ